MMGYIIYRGHYHPETRPEAWSQEYWLSIVTINVGFLLGFAGLYGLWLWIQTWEGEPEDLAIDAGEADGDTKQVNMSTQSEKQRARTFSYYGALTE